MQKKKIFFFSFLRIGKTYTFTLGSLLINDGHVKNTLQDIKQSRISRIFNQVFYTQIMLSEISKNLGNSSMTHALLADEQTMKKSKYIKH